MFHSGLKNGYEELDNDAFVEFRIGGKLYRSVDHYYHAMKFPNHSEYQELIRTVKTPKEAYVIGTRPDLQHFRDEDWQFNKETVMARGMAAKFQNEHYASILRATGIARLMEVSSSAYWGGCPKDFGYGCNRKGKLLEMIRERIGPGEPPHGGIAWQENERSRLRRISVTDSFLGTNRVAIEERQQRIRDRAEGESRESESTEKQDTLLIVSQTMDLAVVEDNYRTVEDKIPKAQTVEDEIERKFRPAAGLQEILSKVSVKVETLVFTDTYYELSALWDGGRTYPLTTKDMWFRVRSGKLELKYPMKFDRGVDASKDVIVGIDYYREESDIARVAELIESKTGIKLIIGTTVEDLIHRNLELQPFMSVITTRTRHHVTLNVKGLEGNGQHMAKVDLDFCDFTPSFAVGTVVEDEKAHYRIGEVELVSKGGDMTAGEAIGDIMDQLGISPETTRGKVLQFLFINREDHHTRLEESGLITAKLGSAQNRERLEGKPKGSAEVKTVYEDWMAFVDTTVKTKTPTEERSDNILKRKPEDRDPEGGSNGSNGRSARTGGGSSLINVAMSRTGGSGSNSSDSRTGGGSNSTNSRTGGGSSSTEVELARVRSERMMQTLMRLSSERQVETMQIISQEVEVTQEDQVEYEKELSSGKAGKHDERGAIVTVKGGIELNQGTLTTDVTISDFPGTTQTQTPNQSEPNLMRNSSEKDIDQVSVETNQVLTAEEIQEIEEMHRLKALAKKERQDKEEEKIARRLMDKAARAIRYAEEVEIRKARILQDELVPNDVEGTCRTCKELSLRHQCNDQEEEYKEAVLRVYEETRKDEAMASEQELSYLTEQSPILGAFCEGCLIREINVSRGMGEKERHVYSPSGRRKEAGKQVAKAKRIDTKRSEPLSKKNRLIKARKERTAINSAVTVGDTEGQGNVYFSEGVSQSDYFHLIKASEDPNTKLSEAMQKEILSKSRTERMAWDGPYRRHVQAVSYTHLTLPTIYSV